jgi:hypothetical protein
VTTNALAKLNGATQALAEAKGLDEIQYARPHLPHLSHELRLKFPVDSLQF